MSTEAEDVDGVESAHTALAEFRATQDECGAFFGGVFDEIQSLSLELFARHKCLEMSAGRKPAADPTLAACREEIRRATDQIEQVAINIETQLDRLSAVASNIGSGRDNSSSETHMAAVMEGMRWQQAEWMQQRAGLEAEVETLRAQLIEKDESLHDQKRHAARQQAELAGELKRMRSLLEALISQIRSETMGHVSGEQTPQVDDMMLNSVLAQFQMLQRDVASVRGGKRNGEVTPAGIHPETDGR